MELDRLRYPVREGVCAERVRAPLGFETAGGAWPRFASRSSAIRLKRTVRVQQRAGALPMAVDCQDALRTRFTEERCKMLITVEHVKPLL
jgi:hypothetical protein